MRVGRLVVGASHLLASSSRLLLRPWPPALDSLTMASTSTRTSYYHAPAATTAARRPAPPLLSSLSPPLRAAAVVVARASSSSPPSAQQPKPARYVYPEGGGGGNKDNNDNTPNAPAPPRFYAPLSPPFLPAGAATVALPPEEARHALRVLRLKPGDTVELCDGAGRVARGEVAAAQPGKGQGGWAVTVALVEPAAAAAAGASSAAAPLLPPQPLPPPGRTWDLVVAAACLSLKGGRDDWLVEKAAELGAAAVLPLATERSPLRPGDLENWSLGAGLGGVVGGGEDASNAGVGGGGGRAAKRRKGSSSSASAASAAATTAPSRANNKNTQDGEGENDKHDDDDKDPFPPADLLALGSGGRLARVAAAATKQCLRTHAPRLLPPATVGELAARLASAKGADRALVATGGAPPVLRQLGRLSGGGNETTQQRLRRRRRLYLVVGPEGDFTPSELEALLGGGDASASASASTVAALPCGLGHTRLRTETAAVAMLAAAAAWVEEREWEE